MNCTCAHFKKLQVVKEWHGESAGFSSQKSTGTFTTQFFIVQSDLKRQKSIWRSCKLPNATTKRIRCISSVYFKFIENPINVARGGAQPRLGLCPKPGMSPTNSCWSPSPPCCFSLVTVLGFSKCHPVEQNYLSAACQSKKGSWLMKQSGGCLSPS